MEGKSERKEEYGLMYLHRSEMGDEAINVKTAVVTYDNADERHLKLNHRTVLTDVHCPRGHFFKFIEGAQAKEGIERPN